jgi:hypothetical protein
MMNGGEHLSEFVRSAKTKTIPNFLTGDVKKIHDYLGSKGIKVAVWGDYLLEV